MSITVLFPVNRREYLSRQTCVNRTKRHKIAYSLLMLFMIFGKFQAASVQISQDAFTVWIRNIQQLVCSSLFSNQVFSFITKFVILNLEKMKLRPKYTEFNIQTALIHFSIRFSETPKRNFTRGGKKRKEREREGITITFSLREQRDCTQDWASNLSDLKKLRPSSSFAPFSLTGVPLDLAFFAEAMAGSDQNTNSIHWRNKSSPVRVPSNSNETYEIRPTISTTRKRERSQLFSVFFFFFG